MIAQARRSRCPAVNCSAVVNHMAGNLKNK